MLKLEMCACMAGCEKQEFEVQRRCSIGKNPHIGYRFSQCARLLALLNVPYRESLVTGSTYTTMDSVRGLMPPALNLPYTALSYGRS